MSSVSEKMHPLARETVDLGRTFSAVSALMIAARGPLVRAHDVRLSGASHKVVVDLPSVVFHMSRSRTDTAAHRAKLRCFSVVEQRRWVAIMMHAFLVDVPEERYHEYNAQIREFVLHMQNISHDSLESPTLENQRIALIVPLLLPEFFVHHRNTQGISQITIAAPAVDDQFFAVRQSIEHALRRKRAQVKFEETIFAKLEERVTKLLNTMRRADLEAASHNAPDVSEDL